VGIHPGEAHAHAIHITADHRLDDREDRAVSGRAQDAYNRWRDANGTHVPVGAQVEQTEVDARRRALRSRLHACGQVTSRGTTRLVVLFEGEDHTVSIRPHLLRVIPG
jgi:polyphosphate kinase 2 (PPK2 family)